MLVLPEKTIFLPPAGGWFQTPLVMREIRQYCINDDTMPMRYDVRWGIQQWHVDFPEIQWSLQKTDPKLFGELLENQRKLARQVFDGIRREHGFTNAMLNPLPLPRFAKPIPDDPWKTDDVLAGYV